MIGSKLPATSGKTESMRTTTAEPQAVPEKKMRRADDAFSVENEADPPSKTAATSRPLDYTTNMTKSQKSKWRKRHEK